MRRRGGNCHQRTCDEGMVVVKVRVETGVGVEQNQR